MKRRKLIFLPFLLLTLNCFCQKEAFKIKGTISNDYDGYIFLSYNSKTDSAFVKNNTFTFQGDVAYPTESRLHIKNGPSADILFLENGTTELGVTINGSITLLNSITGNETEETISDLEHFFQSNGAHPEFSSKLYTKLDSIFSENPRNQAWGMLLSDIIMDPILSNEQIHNLYSKLDKSILSDEITKSIDSSLKNNKLTQIGTRFESIELPDIKGNLISTSKFKNKILLVEFWASWCVPCRKSNPKLVELYNLYNDDGFEIYGVSIDLDKNAWQQAINNDNLPWVNTIESEGFNSQIIKTLNIQYIPSNYLVDTDGNILAINISPELLEKKLSEIL